MGLFGKKKKEEAAPAATPLERVVQMRQQGFQDPQIIDALQKEGYPSSQIYDAINQADIKSTIEASPGTEVEINVSPGAPQVPSGPAPMPEPLPPGAPPGPAPMPEPLPAEGAMPGMPPPPGGIPPAYSAPELKREEIEEIAESIIDEKWNELMKGVDKIVAWKEETETKLVKIEQQIKDIKERFDELHKGVLAKIGDYDKSIRGVGSDIKAMESVFKKILPTFTENVGELSRITKDIKSKKRKTTK